MHPYPRTIIALTGPDSASFLQGVTTQDMNLLNADQLHLTTFLSPQGKLQHDALCWREGETIYLDTHEATADELIQFLTRYKLRAKVIIEKSGLSLSLFASESNEGVADPRHASMPRRHYRMPQATNAIDYHTTRIALGIPEAGYDSKGDDTAMDLGYDSLGAISFTKGCYVGQEVTARMYYKQIARKSIVHVATEAEFELPAPFSTIVAGPLTLGTLRSHDGANGLALVNLDKWEEAIHSSHPIQCEHIPLTLQWPEWASPKRELWRQAKLAPSA